MINFVFSFLGKIDLRNSECILIKRNNYVNNFTAFRKIFIFYSLKITISRNRRNNEIVRSIEKKNIRVIK